jgi:ergothioneine biosynthesis protein EgtB
VSKLVKNKRRMATVTQAQNKTVLQPALQKKQEVKESSLLVDYKNIRQYSEHLIANLSAEDCALQAADFVSPAKWHLAHTSWFFETFILLPANPAYVVFNDHFQVLFNSYYNGIGEQFPRPQRHLLSRPSLKDVLAYRSHIDAAMNTLSSTVLAQQASLILLGLNHEQQHQELLLMDTKYNFFQNPLYPALLPAHKAAYSNSHENMSFVAFSGGVKSIGTNTSEIFCFDNETPQHNQYLANFQLSNRLVTNGEYLKFIQNGGYDDASLWLSDGWSTLQKFRTHNYSNASPKIPAPLYWVQKEGQWFEFSLRGLISIDPNQPVRHLSFYEANAYAAWAGCRLPSEAEWEVAARQEHPTLLQMFDVCWQWTQSAYAPYPGFKATSGAVGEYNGKFMCNQMVLRGGCGLTPNGHVRASYRNFFYPQDQWPMTGLRLAKDTM